jgi:hypothetical protein
MLMNHVVRQVREKAALCVVPRHEVKADMRHDEKAANVREDIDEWEFWSDWSVRPDVDVYNGVKRHGNSRPGLDANTGRMVIALFAWSMIDKCVAKYCSRSAYRTHVMFLLL